MSNEGRLQTFKAWRAAVISLRETYRASFPGVNSRAAPAYTSGARRLIEVTNVCPDGLLDSETGSSDVHQRDTPLAAAQRNGLVAWGQCVRLCIRRNGPRMYVAAISRSSASSETFKNFFSAVS